jgi:hypothetical protein
MLKNIFLNNFKFITNLTVILVCLALSLLFPSQNTIQGLTKTVFFLVIIPAFYVKFVLKEKISDFGLNMKNKKTGLIWGTTMLFSGIAIFYLIINFTSFAKNYQIYGLFANNFWFFTLNMLVFLNIMFFCQECFFHGFVLSVFRPAVFGWSVIFQTLIFYSILLISNDDISESFSRTVPFLFLSLAGGLVAYKTRSIVYSYAAGLVFLIIFNAYLIYSIKSL